MKNKTVEFLPGDDKNEDVEGHLIARLAPPAEDEDDVEGHRRKTALAPEADDDVEGHRRKTALAPEADDDVEGHVQPPRDLDVERF